MTALRVELGEDFELRVAALLETHARALAETLGSPWMDAGEAAEYMRCKVARVRKLTMSGDLPGHHEGGRRLYRRDEVDAFIRSGGSTTC